MIRVACPHCQRTFRTKTEAMGRVAVCSGCHESFTIGEARPAFTWKLTGLAEDSWVGVEPPEEKEALRHCIMCEAPIEPGIAKCPECGTNQVTGLVQRPRREAVTEKRGLGGAFPVRLAVTLAVMAVVAAIGYWLIIKVTHSFVTTSEQLADGAVVRDAAAVLDKSDDPEVLRLEYTGRVTDDNLSNFVKLLAAEDASRRRAAAVLIGYGRVTDVRPLLDPPEDLKIDDKDVVAALEAIGARKLVELTNGDDAALRRAAARGLVTLFDLEHKDEVLDALTEKTAFADKVSRLNEMTRPWPEATGSFKVVIGEEQSPFVVTIDQIGRTFYLTLPYGEFRSSSDGRRRFDIRIERWCAATAPAVDTEALRDLLRGFVVLGSPFGVGWEGLVRVVLKDVMREEIPGFLPVDPPKVGQTAEATIRLVRP